MRSWWHDQHALSGQDAQWIALRRALDFSAAADPAAAAAAAPNRIRRKSKALLEQSQILQAIRIAPRRG